MTSKAAGSSNFTEVVPEQTRIIRSLIVNIFGEEKSGKTDWPLRSAPGPLYHIILDPNAKRIADKISMMMQRGELPRRPLFVKLMGIQRPGNKAMWEKGWQEFRAAYDEALKGARGGGTIIVDTGTELYELRRLMEFGRESGMARNYGPIYQDMRAIYSDAFDAEVNLFVIHKMTDEWINDKSTGRRKPDMYKDVPFQVQANLEMILNTDPNYKEHRFSVKTHVNNMGMHLTGTTMTTDFCTFEQYLALTFDV